MAGPSAEFVRYAENAGWRLDKLTEGPTLCTAVVARGDEQLAVRWVWRSSGIVCWRFQRAARRFGEAPAEPLTQKGVYAALIAPPARQEGDEVVRLPFGLDEPDEAVLAALAGCTVHWRNTISGQIEKAKVPRGGLNLRLVADPLSAARGRRTLTFPSATGTGYRSVRLDAIRKVT